MKILRFGLCLDNSGVAVRETTLSKSLPTPSETLYANISKCYLYTLKSEYHQAVPL